MLLQGTIFSQSEELSDGHLAYNCDNRNIFLELPDNSIDLILTDPPYKDYQSNRPVSHAKVKKINVSDFDLAFFIRQSARVLKPGCHFYCWCDHNTFPSIYQEIITCREEARKIRSKQYLRYKNCLIWVKNNHGSGDLKGNFAPQHEFIIFAAKGKPGRQLNGKRPSNVLFKRSASGVEFYKKINNYDFDHGTTKPVEILELLINISTGPGEIVFDPYAGTMSTAEACLNTRRKSIIVEIDSEHYRHGLERIKSRIIFKP